MTDKPRRFDWDQEDSGAIPFLQPTSNSKSFNRAKNGLHDNLMATWRQSIVYQQDPYSGSLELELIREIKRTEP